MLKAKRHISDTKELVGYVIKHMTADLVCCALDNIAIKNRRLSQDRCGLIIIVKHVTKISQV